MKEGVREAERLISEQHYDSAIRKLVEMQKRNPCMVDLVGSMLTLCQVLSAAKLRLPGLGVDHYWVLNASPLHEPCRIRAHYDLLLTSLHPLRSKFPAAADSALEAVERAFSVISDHQKRSLFDSRRSAARQVLPEKPSQDFFHFAAHRESCHLEEGQIWAATALNPKEGHAHRYGRLSFRGAVCLVSWLRPIPVSPGERRWCHSGLPVSCGTFEVCPDEAAPDPDPEMRWRAYNCDWVRGALEGQFEIYPRRGEVWAIYQDWSMEEWPYWGPDALKHCKLDLVEITSEFSKYTGVHCARLRKVGGFGYVFEREAGRESLHVGPSMFYMFSHRVPAYRFTGGELDGVAEGMVELDGTALPGGTIHEEEEEEEGPCFRQGQIWALCCGDDSMPRQYARVDGAVSELEVRVTFLEPVVTEWRSEKLPIVCGVFKVGTETQEVQVSRLSYAVKWRERNHPFYVIHPMKGEIWAVYNRWSSECDHHIVLLLSDTSEGDAAKIASLQRVPGCLTFFHIHAFHLTCLLSFSHRIPAFRVPGIAAFGIPEASWHLEPSALPPGF